MAEDSELKLCYIEGNWAYFTTQSLEEQWGDDWDDAPYEHNAEEPYESREGLWTITKVAFECDLVEPREDFNNSPYSVQDINQKKVPWLRSSRWAEEPIVEIYAEVTLDKFIKAIQVIGGKVYREIK